MSENFRSEKTKTGNCAKVMTHFAGENWNGNHLPGTASVYNSAEVPFPQIWNQDTPAAYNEIIGFQDLGEWRKMLGFSVKISPNIFPFKF